MLRDYSVLFCLQNQAGDHQRVIQYRNCQSRFVSDRFTPDLLAFPILSVYI